MARATPAPDPIRLHNATEVLMADSSDILLAAGVLGGAWWIIQQHDRDAGTHAQLSQEATENARTLAGLHLAQAQNARARAEDEARRLEAQLAELAVRAAATPAG